MIYKMIFLRAQTENIQQSFHDPVQEGMKNEIHTSIFARHS